ncbi:MAG: hypothetical protein O2923_04535 [Verrucomicrobia bacterium]|nr:hypothetical protein [Verrucomicrobiota bacterium]MDA1085717.1 hypothetical protein [Verrucomicrobiota bacterium]
MKSETRKIAVVITAVLLMTGLGLAVANDKDHGTPAEKAGGAEEGVRAYPLKICLVSDEEVGSMGEAPSLVFKQEIKFCCKGCLKDFNKDPLKYVAKLVAEIEKQKGGASPAQIKGAAHKEKSSHKKADDHSGHDH